MTSRDGGREPMFFDQGAYDIKCGRELIEKGRPEDVRLAAQVDVSECAPILREGAYVAATAPPTPP